MYVPTNPKQHIGYSANETIQSYEILLGKENFKMRNDEKSVSPYKLPKLPTLLSPKLNTLIVNTYRVAGVLQPSLHSCHRKFAKAKIFFAKANF